MLGQTCSRKGISVLFHLLMITSKVSVEGEGGWWSRSASLQFIRVVLVCAWIFDYVAFDRVSKSALLATHRVEQLSKGCGLPFDIAHL